MSRIFSILCFVALATSGCAAIVSPQVWTQDQALVSANPAADFLLIPSAADLNWQADQKDEQKFAVVPEEERLLQSDSPPVSSPDFPETSPSNIPLENHPSGLTEFSAPQQLAAVERTTPSTTVRVYYGSNRSDRGEISTNHYGTCDVSIPSRHRFGELERPSLWKLEFRETSARHVMVQSVSRQTDDLYWNQLRSDLSQTDTPAVFVFVHGYNVTFQEAAMRTAQMAFDLRFRGIPVMYSWPSMGTVTGYGHDQRAADLSSGALSEFLTRIALESGARQIHLVAHSMGNRTLVGALARIHDVRPYLHFNQVVFAAPDLDARVFATQIAPRIQPLVDRATIYSSGSDLALWASQFLNRTMRLGRPGYYLNILDRWNWVDVIDSTAVGFDWFEFGHSAYGGVLLADLQRVFEGRPATPESVSGTGRVWTVGRPAPSAAPSPPRSFPARNSHERPAQWPPAPVDRWR